VRLSGSGTAQGSLVDITTSWFTTLSAINLSARDSPASFSGSGLLIAGHLYRIYLELDGWTGSSEN